MEQQVKLTIERDGVIRHIVIRRDLLTSTKSIKWGSGRKWAIVDIREAE